MGLYRNGAVIVTIDIADHLQSTGRYEATILSYQGVRLIRPPTDVAVRTASLRGMSLLPRAWRQRFKHWQRQRFLTQSVRAADLIVVPDDVGPTLTEATRIATGLGKPLCCIVHIDLDHKFSSPDFNFGIPEIPDQWSKAQTLAHYRHADRIICVSRGIRDSLVQDMPEKADAIITIQNGVDLARLDRLAAEALPADRPLPALPFFMGAGRLVHAKGFDLLIEAHARVLARGGPPHAIVLVGEGKQQQALEQQAAMLGVRDTVRFYGYAANPFPIMARATALCSPSRFEGFPLTTTEGSALGIPVIATTARMGRRRSWSTAATAPCCRRRIPRAWPRRCWRIWSTPRRSGRRRRPRSGPGSACRSSAASSSTRRSSTPCCSPPPPHPSPSPCSPDADPRVPERPLLVDV